MTIYVPLIPAQAGIQDRALGPRFRGDEWATFRTPLTRLALPRSAASPRARGEVKIGKRVSVAWSHFRFMA